MRHAVEGRGGSVTELRGDEALAVFDSARQAILAGLDLQSRFAEERAADGSPPLSVGIGLDAGEAVPVAGGYRGGALNLAARLCSLAAPDEVLASRGIVHLARKIDGVTYVDRGSIPVKGLAEPVHVVEITAASTHAPPPEASKPKEPAAAFQEPASTTLLERDAPLAALGGYLADVVDSGRGRLVLVGGEAGIGKTALVRRFCARHSEQVLWGACDSLFTPRPLGPLLDVAETTGGELARLAREGARPHEVAAALMHVLGERAATILILEDVHWADEATLDVLRLVTRRIDAIPVLVVATYRDDELDRSPLLRVVLGEVGRAERAARLNLERLSPTAVAELAAPYHLDPVRLHDKTAGNPFFVSEVLAAGGDGIPDSVRDAVLARSAQLGAAARTVLEAVAVVPPQAELWLLDELVPDGGGLEECLASGMLTSTTGAVGFRHELARLAVEESLPPNRSRALHRRALDALVSVDEDLLDLARLAHHADAAGDADAVLRFAPAAADRAAALGAHREAAAQYARALRFGDRLTAGERGDLLRKRAVECMLTDHYDDALASATDAIEEYREAGNRLGEGDALRIRSDVGWCPGYIAECTRDAREAIELLETVPPSSELAHAYANLGGLYKDAEDREEAEAWARRAIGLGQEVGADDVVIRAKTDLGAMELLAGSPNGVDMLESALAEAVEKGLVDQAGRIYINLIRPGATVRDYAILERHRTDALAWCSDHGLELYRLYLLAYQGRVALDTGRWDDAVDSADAVLRVPRCSTSPRILTLVVLALVRARRGDPGVHDLLDEAWSLAEPTGELPRIGPVAVAQAEVAWLEGRPEAVAGVTDAALELAVRRASLWRIGELAAWRSRAGLADGLAADVTGPFALQLAGDWSGAAEQWARKGCPYEAALALAETGDEALLRQALDELRRLGAGAAAAIVARRLRERGARGLPRGPRPATLQNPAQLTAREVEVLSLLAEGLQNAEIASRLVVSRRTVDHHVATILRKLDVRTRGQASAEAVRLGLAGQDR